VLVLIFFMIRSEVIFSARILPEVTEGSCSHQG
jgi:hypothetical protein